MFLQRSHRRRYRRRCIIIFNYNQVNKTLSNQQNRCCNDSTVDDTVDGELFVSP
jgi:hypothetical protein